MCLSVQSHFLKAVLWTELVEKHEALEDRKKKAVGDKQSSRLTRNLYFLLCVLKLPRMLGKVFAKRPSEGMLSTSILLLD